VPGGSSRNVRVRRGAVKLNFITSVILIWRRPPSADSPEVPHRPPLRNLPLGGGPNSPSARRILR